MNVTTEIVRALVAASPNPVSGEVLAEQLGVSRMAVSKVVSRLLASGYEITSKPRVGYSLTQIPRGLDAHTIEALVEGEFWAHIQTFASVGSTNDEAREALSHRIKTPAAFIAQAQTSGRGRLGRSWASPAGGAYLSLLVTDRIAMVTASTISLVVGIVVVESLKRVGVEAQIKWPNDIVVNGRKIAGILVEMTSDIDGVSSMVIGIGLNIIRPDGAVDLDEHVNPSYLSDIIDDTFSTSALVADILSNFQYCYQRWLIEGFSPFLNRFSQVQSQVGQDVEVFNQVGSLLGSGVVQGVDELGRLLLTSGSDSSTNTRAISAGEVTQRKVNPA